MHTTLLASEPWPSSPTSRRSRSISRSWPGSIPIAPPGQRAATSGSSRAGDTTPEFEQALLALHPGETTATPVETRYGFHIIRLERRIPGRELPFEAVRERIADYLVERSRRLAIAQYVARLAAHAQLSGVDLRTPDEFRVH